MPFAFDLSAIVKNIPKEQLNKRKARAEITMDLRSRAEACLMTAGTFCAGPAQLRGRRLCAAADAAIIGGVRFRAATEPLPSRARPRRRGAARLRLTYGFSLSAI